MFSRGMQLMILKSTVFALEMMDMAALLFICPAIAAV